MNSTYLKSLCLIALGAILLVPDLVIAQSSGGKLSIRENGFISVFGQHSFMKGSGIVPAGKIITERKGKKGYLNFVKGSSWIGASNTNHVDGYVKVYHNQPFVFPIGDNNIFRPIAITGAAKTSAAYYEKDPTTVHPSLPNSSSDLKRVSNREYWDIGGATPTKLSLSWNPKSNIANITNGKLENLTIVGVKDGKWEVIPSNTKSEVAALIHNLQKNVKASNSFDAGVIASSKEIVPNDYDYFTLGAISEEKSTQELTVTTPAMVYPNPVQTELTVDLKPFEGTEATISIYNMHGHLVQQKEFKQGFPDLQQFDMSEMMNGIYKVYVRTKHQEYVQRFVVERLY